jgi:small GTP-binding protein
LNNFVNSNKDIEIAFLYSREGLLIGKSDKLDTQEYNGKELADVYGAITTIAENLLTRISKEYKIGHYGSGSFETPDHRIIFLEAGPEAILIIFCNYDLNLNKVLPVAYLVAEKATQLLEDKFDFNYNSLEIPNLVIYDEFSLNLDKKYPPISSESEYDNIKMTHHIVRSKEFKSAFKLIVLGSAAVGKTTLINSFLKKDQTGDYRATIGIAISSKKFYIQGFENEIIDLLIYDLAGQEFFKRVRHEYYRGAKCAFIVYDITRRDTFIEAIDFWYKDAKKELGDIPVVLIGNKIDLQSQREVSFQEVKEKAEELKCFFIETSALYNINVQDTFKLIGIGLLFISAEENL